MSKKTAIHGLRWAINKVAPLKLTVETNVLVIANVGKYGHKVKGKKNENKLNIQAKLPLSVQVD